MKSENDGVLPLRIIRSIGIFLILCLVITAPLFGDLEQFKEEVEEEEGGGLGNLSMDEMEKRHIEETLRRHNNDKSATADALGIHRTTLWRKMKKLGIETEGEKK